MRIHPPRFVLERFWAHDTNINCISGEGGPARYVFNHLWVTLLKMPEDYRPNANSVRQIFNEMADEYDHLSDLWYRYSFSRINSIIKNHFAPGPGDSPNRVLVDVGCGTGIQSLAFAELGYQIIGIDIAENLLKIAEEKLDSTFPGRAMFLRGDAQSLPLPDAVGDVVNCCGPTISFVPDYEQAFREMSRVLKPGGRLILECEQKWNFDMLWEVLNALFGNVFEYDESLSEAIRHFLPPLSKGHYVKYAFRTESGDKSYMFLKLFTAKELRSALARAGLKVDREFGIHILTNLIPSTVLHDASPAAVVQQVFGVLARVENSLYDKWPFSHFGCSLVITATKL